MKKTIILLFCLTFITISYGIQIINQTTFPIKVVVNYGCPSGNDGGISDIEKGYAKYSFQLQNKGDITDVIPSMVSKAKSICNLDIESIRATIFISDSNLEITKTWDKIPRNQNIISIVPDRNLAVQGLNLR